MKWTQLMFDYSVQYMTCLHSLFGSDYQWFSQSRCSSLAEGENTWNNECPWLRPLSPHSWHSSLMKCICTEQTAEKHKWCSFTKDNGKEKVIGRMYLYQRPIVKLGQTILLFSIFLVPGIKPRISNISLFCSTWALLGRNYFNEGFLP